MGFVKTWECDKCGAVDEGKKQPGWWFLELKSLEHWDKVSSYGASAKALLCPKCVAKVEKLVEKLLDR